jgi:hypothetical protein
MARLELAKTWHRHRCRRGLRWLWHQDPNAEPFPALSRKGDMPRSFLVPLGARMPDSSVPPSEWTAPGTAQSRTGPRRANLFRHTGAGRAGLHLGTQPGQPRTRPQRHRPTVTFLSDRERQLRAEFLEAARREMGYAGEPLLRRTHTKADQSKASTRASIHP